MAQSEHGADDVLVLGTDGLWDVLSNQEVAEAVTCFLANCDPDDQHRHVRSSQLQLLVRAELPLTPVLFGEDERCYLVVIMQISKQISPFSDVKEKLVRLLTGHTHSSSPVGLKVHCNIL